MHADYFLLCINEIVKKRERNKIQKGKKNPDHMGRDGGDEWTRTTDSRIFSPMLYQLSYITVL
jgi:hypothetical protein|tara:strand:- start:188 stop:376 length:189 start_codon:yes stop_codon:yes gene_type:complete